MWFSSECRVRCPECDVVTKVVDSRSKPGYNYRRRQCSCGTRFSTKEVAFNVVSIVKVVPTDDAKRKAELERLEELNKLIAAQARDARAKWAVGGSRVSVIAKTSLDRRSYNYDM